MKFLTMVLLSSAFMFTSCAHKGHQASCCGEEMSCCSAEASCKDKKNCDGKKCDLKKEDKKKS